MPLLTGECNRCVREREVGQIGLKQVSVVNEGAALVCGSVGAGLLESLKRQMEASPTISSRLATLNLREVFGGLPSTRLPWHRIRHPTSSVAQLE